MIFILADLLYSHHLISWADYLFHSRAVKESRRLQTEVGVHTYPETTLPQMCNLWVCCAPSSYSGWVLSGNLRHSDCRVNTALHTLTVQAKVFVYTHKHTSNHKHAFRFVLIHLKVHTKGKNLNFLTSTHTCFSLNSWGWSSTSPIQHLSKSRNHRWLIQTLKSKT